MTFEEWVEAYKQGETMKINNDLKATAREAGRAIQKAFEYEIESGLSIGAAKERIADNAALRIATDLQNEREQRRLIQIDDDEEASTLVEASHPHQDVQLDFIPAWEATLYHYNPPTIQEALEHLEEVGWVFNEPKKITVDFT